MQNLQCSSKLNVLKAVSLTSMSFLFCIIFSARKVYLITSNYFFFMKMTEFSAYFDVTH